LSSKPFIDTLLIETLLKDETVIAVFGSQSLRAFISDRSIGFPILAEPRCRSRRSRAVAARLRCQQSTPKLRITH